VANTNPDFIVGIGGSAGGLKAYLALLDALPPNTGMAFVVISHLNPIGESFLSQILSRATAMPVTQASEGMPIQANHVYVIPPNANLLIDKYTFKVVSPRTMSRGRHKQVDYFLMSLAEFMGARAISIILSGGDGDGTEGCRYIKAKGGITFAQDLSAEVDSMPLHALASGCVDFVLPPEGISEELAKIGARFSRDQSRAQSSPETAKGQ
jgi:two-component system CheB/CheR fusion protein